MNISDIFSVTLYQPLYNGLVFLISIVPFADVGIAVVLLTLLVKLILFPFTHTSIKTQAKIKTIQPEIDKIKGELKNDKQEQARHVMQLYKDKGINPFSGVLLIIIQIPIILALYWVFFRGGLPEINIDILYSFIEAPRMVNMDFIGLIDVSGRSIILAALAGISQYFQIKFSLPPMKERTESPSLKDDLARSFQLQMRYVLPVFIFIFSYFISAAVALYWVTSNIFAIGQEIVIRRKIRD